MTKKYNFFLTPYGFESHSINGFTVFPKSGYLLLKVMTIMLLLLGFVQDVQSQTMLLDPNGDGGFENSGNNGWTFLNSSPNYFTIGATSTPSAGIKAAFVTNDGFSHAYTPTVNTPVYSWFYRDISVPAGQDIVTLSYKRNQGCILVIFQKKKPLKKARI